MYAICPNCGEIMEVELAHDGVASCWHGVHCGSARDFYSPDEVYSTPEDAADAAASK